MIQVIAAAVWNASGYSYSTWLIVFFINKDGSFSCSKGLSHCSVERN